MKNVIILSGVSGCGKSTAALAMVGGDRSLVCEANQYMLNDKGEYEFDYAKLDECHRLCFLKFQELCDRDVPLVVQSNTNLVAHEYDRYVKYARSKGYTVHFMLVTKPEEYRNHRELPGTLVAWQGEVFERNVSKHHRRVRQHQNQTDQRSRQ